jgi:hypothetical protein
LRELRADGKYHQYVDEQSSHSLWQAHAHVRRHMILRKDCLDEIIVLLHMISKSRDKNVALIAEAHIKPMRHGFVECAVTSILKWNAL